VGADPGIHTFLIADIRGYTAYTEDHGDEDAAVLAARFAADLEPVMTAHGGQLLELRGDEALVVFSSARRAIRAAVAVQQRVAGPDDQALPVGIGLDAGEAVPVRGGFRGAALNTPHGCAASPRRARFSALPRSCTSRPACRGFASSRTGTTGSRASPIPCT